MANFYFKSLIYLFLFLLFNGLLIDFLVKKILNNWITKINEIIEQISCDKNIDSMDFPTSLKKFYDALCKLQRVLNKSKKRHNQIIKIIDTIAINIDLDKFLSEFLPQVLDITESLCSAFYLVNHFTNKLELKYSIGFNKNIYQEFDLQANEFLQINQDIKIINDIPNDSVYIIKGFTGKVKPKSLMIVSVINKNELIGILILASIYNYTDAQIEIINSIRSYLSIAIENGKNIEKKDRLINELSFQNKLIQDLNDELEAKIKNLNKK